MSIQTKVPTSPFIPKGHPVIVSKFDEEFVHYYDKEVLVDPESIDPEKPDEFLTEKVATEYERIPIREYINQFASRVGLKNELKGIISKQQMDDFIAEHKAQPGFVDLTTLPDTAFEMEQLAASVDKVWADVPEELKNGMTKEEFLKTFNNDKLKDYVLSEVAKQTAAESKKEGE